MKCKKPPFYSILLIVSIFLSCKKEGNSNVNQPQPTTLEITVKDISGTLTSGVTVKLYSSLQDFLAGLGGSTPIAVATTASQGTVTFKNVELGKEYYWFAEKDCSNNFVSGTYGPKTVSVANSTGYASCQIQASGNLTFNNKSTNLYNVYINGNLAIPNMSGNTIRTLSWRPVGSYTIRVVQQSGYVFSPTDQSYVGDLNCGSTLTTTFP